MTATFYTWEELRASWVNGNQSECLEFMRQCNKTRLFKILAECFYTANALQDNPPHTHSGDLDDLYEIIHRLSRGI